MRFRPLRSSLVLVAARAARLPTIVVTDTRQAEAEIELPGVRGATAVNVGAGVPWAAGPGAYAIKTREFARCGGVRTRHSARICAFAWQAPPPTPPSRARTWPMIGP